MKEIRHTIIRAQKPTVEGDKALLLVGRPILYETPSEISDESGNFTEIIQRGALDNADMSDVRLLVGHDFSRLPLARTPKTLKLSLDEQGLLFEATLPDTEAGKEAFLAVQRGDIKGLSFAFTIPEGGDSYNAETNTRRITRIAKLYECSLTAFPAYRETVVSAESRAVRQRLASSYADKCKAQILINQILMETV